MTAALVAALERRVAGDASRPLLTWYDLTTGDRVEFSARTFANWADKTVNLMASMGADDQPVVAMPLLLSHPGHWVELVWAMATWQIGGCVVALPREELDVVDLAVIGPDRVHPVPGAETVACSLHPLGMAFPQAPSAVTDFAEALTQPDVHWTSPSAPDEPAFLDATGRRDGSEVDAVGPSAERRVLHVGQGSDPWRVLAHALAAPVLGGGSVVLVTGSASADDLQRVVDAEQASGVLSL